MANQAGSIRVTNATAYERRSLVTVRHPFMPGTCRVGDNVTVASIPAVVDMEELWPCGSVRSARLRVPLEIGGSEDGSKTVQVSPHPAAMSAFRMHPWVAEGLSSTHVEFMGVNLLWGLKLIDSSAYTQTYQSRHRVPDTHIWVEYTGEAYHDIPYVAFWIRWGYSDSRQTHTVFRRHRVWLKTSNVLTRIRHGKARRLDVDGQMILDEPGDGRGDSVRSGQSQMLAGVRMFPPGQQLNPFESTLSMHTLQAENVQPILSISESWPDVPGAYGPFGVVPESGRNDAAQREQLLGQAVREWNRRPIWNPWDNTQHICNKAPGDTGAQKDFGITKLGRDIRAGAPYRLRGVEASVHQEACRPSHHREPDASPLRAKDHPELWLFGGWPHRHSPDQLNGDWAESDFRTLADWWGFDIEHHSINHLAEFAYVTGDPGAIILANEEADIWLGQYQNRGSWPGPGRRDGRVLHAGCWLHHATGRDDLKERVRSLADLVLGDNQVVYRRGIRKGDNGVRGRTDYWVPWEQAMRVYGLEAATRITSDTRYRDFAKATARKVALEGFDDLNLVKYAAAWEDSGDFDRGGGGLTEWSMPCIVLGQRWAKESGDGEWEQRCSQILGSMMSSRDKSKAFDAVFDWLAV